MEGNSKIDVLSSDCSDNEYNDSELEDNNLEIDENNIRTEEENQKKRRKPRGCYLKRLGMPYFKDKRLFACPPNEDALFLRKNNHTLIYSQCWNYLNTSSDVNHVKVALRKYWQDKEIKSLQKKLLHLEQNKKQKLIHDDELDYMKQKKYLNETLENVNKLSYEELCETHNKRKIDWMVLHAQYITVSRISVENCERIWSMHLNPELDLTPFSKEETDKIMQLAEEYNEQNWIKIAESLPTKRTAFHCMQHYKTHLKALKKPWTKEEDELLISLVKEFDSAGNLRWPLIGRSFPNRNYIQCKSRWNYCLKPGLKKGKYTDEEKKVIEHELQKGTSNKKIAQKLNRSTICITNYDNKLKNNQFNKGSWTVDETIKLIKIVDSQEKKQSQDWSAISKILQSRDRTQCRQKYGSLIQMGYSNLLELAEIIIKKYPKMNTPLSKRSLYKLRQFDHELENDMEDL